MDCCDGNKNFVVCNSGQPWFTQKVSFELQHLREAILRIFHMVLSWETEDLTRVYSYTKNLGIESVALVDHLKPDTGNETTGSVYIQCHTQVGKAGVSMAF